MLYLVLALVDGPTVPTQFPFGPTLPTRAESVDDLGHEHASGATLQLLCGELQGLGRILGENQNTHMALSPESKVMTNDSRKPFLRNFSPNQGSWL
jgi:hypothetical protein